MRNPWAAFVTEITALVLKSRIYTHCKVTDMTFSYQGTQINRLEVIKLVISRFAPQ